MVLCGMCDYYIVGMIVRGMEVNTETKKLLKKMDPFTALLMSTGPASIIKEGKAPYDNGDIKTELINLGWSKTGPGFGDWVKKNVKVSTKKISDKKSIKTITEDDILGPVDTTDVITNWALRQRWIFSLSDKDDIFFKDNEEAQMVNEELKMVMGEGLPESYLDWEDMTTDAALTRIFFYGMGACLIAAQPQRTDDELGPFCVDLPVQDLETRSGFRRMGCRVHFDADQKPTGIFDYQHKLLVKPGDVEWEEAKLLARVTVGTVVTAREHLLWTHLIMSNTVTMSSILNLFPSHPIRRLLTIFTFGTNAVNARAFEVLVPDSAIFHRATGFKHSAIEKMFNDGFDACDIFEPFSDRDICPSVKELSDDGKFPYIAEGSAYFDIVRTFVSNWIAEAGDEATDSFAEAFYKEVQSVSVGMKYELPEFSTDALVNLCAQMIFCVTAYHELVGGVVEYFRLPSRFGFRITEGATSVDVQSYLIASIVSGSTSIKMPMLMKGFPNFFGAGGAKEWERDVWNTFVADLAEQENVVVENEANRDFEYRACNPRRFECSVSV